MKPDYLTQVPDNMDDPYVHSKKTSRPRVAVGAPKGHQRGTRGTKIDWSVFDGPCLRHCRLRFGWTQVRLAAYLGISRRLLRNCEHGLRKPELMWAKGLQELMGKDMLEDLVREYLAAKERRAALRKVAGGGG